MTNANDVFNLIEQYKQDGGDATTLRSGIDAMYSADKTSLGLNQWQLTDKPRMEDFNRDNRIIDEKIVELQESIVGLQTKKVDTGKAGTWTPRIFGETIAGDPVYTERSGNYYTVGGLVICRGTIKLSSKGGMAGNLVIDGFPVKNRMVVSAPPFNIGGLSLASGQMCTGLAMFENFARLRWQTGTGSAWVTADMITDYLTAYYFTSVYASY